MTSLLRYGLILACFVCLWGLGHYFALLVEELPHTMESCSHEPMNCDGIEMGITVSVLKILDDTHYQIGRGGIELLVLGDPKNLKVGQWVSVSGKFDGSNRQLIESYHEVHHYRVLKEVYGLVGLLCILIGVWKRWSIGPNGLIENA